MTTYGQPALQEEILDAIEESFISVNLPGRHHIWLSGNDDPLFACQTAGEEWQPLQQFYRFG